MTHTLQAPTGEAALHLGLALIARGYSVLLWKPTWNAKKGKFDKKPVGGGADHTTRDPDELRRRFTRFPDAAIGVRRGHGISIVDDDSYKLAELPPATIAMREHLEMLALTGETYMLPTASGGRHYYFANLGGLTNSKCTVPGFELFDNNGFIAVTGELPDIKTLSPLPAETTALLTSSPAPATALSAAASTAPDCSSDADVAGAGNTSAVDEVRALLSKMDPDCTYDEWVTAGMAAGAAAGDPGVDAWIERSSLSKTKFPGREALIDKAKSFKPDGGIGIGTLRKLYGSNVSTTDEFEVVTFEQAEDPFEPEVKLLNFSTLGDFKRAPWPTWFIRDWLPVAEINMLFGPSGVGKSFLALDMALAIARGVQWAGRHRVRQSDVWWWAAEAYDSMKPRSLAYGLEHKINDIEGAVPNFRVVRGCHLGDKNYVDRMIATIKAHLAPGHKALAVIDTLAAANDGRDENTSQMNDLLDSCRRIYAETLGQVSVLLIHHSGKESEKGARGWSGIRAAVQGELKLDWKGEDRVLENTKQRDGDEDGCYLIAFKPHVVGTDEFGDPIKSVAVLPMPYTTAAGEFSGAGAKWAPVVVRVLEELAAKSPGVPVSVKELRAAFESSAEVLKESMTSGAVRARMGEGARCAERAGRLHAVDGGYRLGASLDGFDDLTTGVAP